MHPGFDKTSTKLSLRGYSLRKILIADGNTKMLTMLKSFLEVRDFKIFTTTSAGDIMDLAREIQPDLVIMDFEMEEMNAEEVCRRLKRNDSTQRISVMITTGREPEKIKAQCLLAGATAIVRKAEGRDALLRNVTQVLGLVKRAHVRTSCDFRVGIEDGGELVEGVAQNISQSGLYLTTRTILQGGTALRLSFELPGVGERLEILSEVVRIESLVGGLYGYGIQFLEANPASLQALQHFAATHSEKETA